MMRDLKLVIRGAVCACLALALAGCGQQNAATGAAGGNANGGANPSTGGQDGSGAGGGSSLGGAVPIGQTEFVSHVPSSSDADGALESAAGTGGAALASADPQATDDGASERAIEEADIIKVEGDRLYALSRYSGLTIIDVSDATDLKLRGSHRSTATPFEMYIEGERAYVMYNGWGRYEFDALAGYWSWQTSSRIQALDVSDPDDILLLGQFDLPGEVSDSRKVGDVLYLVTYEDGYCYRCEENPNTRVAAFNVEDPDDFVLVDQLRFEEEDESWGKRSISVTPARIYVSGRNWNDDATGVINVVDISDPAGSIEAGDEVRIAGPIESRWQMDEYQGVLRVISQPGGWNTSAPPVVETFEVNSSDEINPLGSVEMVLPRPEDLRSVRFDGERAYAITFERTDPLFTLDLSEPAAPQQVGELEIPGWVYHMEPRGDRIYALGFDDASETGGALHVSLFDVSTLSDPQQLARVNFGGRWANFAEDQDRIHKAFNIMADEGLILVPFAGWDYADEDECGYQGGEYLSGIQLVDMTTETLNLRGVAPQVGQARRGFLIDEQLFGLSDNALQTFDISDRDAPAGLDRLELARNVTEIKVMTDDDGKNTMLRFGADWWTEETVLDFAEMDRVDQAEPVGDIDLSELELVEQTCDSYSYWNGQVFVEEDTAYVPRRTYYYGGEEEGDKNVADFYVVDLEDRENPKVTGQFSVETDREGEYLTSTTKTDSALLVGRRRYVQDDDSYRYELSFDVFSLENPQAPTKVSNFEVPSNLSMGGWGYNVSGCAIDIGWGFWYGGEPQALVSGDILVSQHNEPLDDDSGRVRYFLDRIDVSDPSLPQVLEAVNIPGSVIDFDADSGRIVTMDYSYEEAPAEDWDECQQGYFDYDALTCRYYRRMVNTLLLEGDVATLVDQVQLDTADVFSSSVAVTKTRLFAYYFRSDGEADGLRSFRIQSDGALEELQPLELETGSWGRVVARDARAYISSYGQLTIVDAADPEELRVQYNEMGGYSCSSLEVVGNTAYCALGYRGVQAFTFE